MKKIYYTCLALSMMAVSLLSGCSSDDSIGVRNKLISAGFDDTDSRVTYAYWQGTETVNGAATYVKKIKVNWADGDKMDVYAGSVSAATKSTPAFTLNAGSGTQSATFGGGELKGDLTDGTTKLYAYVEKTGQTIDETNSTVTVELTGQSGKLADASMKDVLFASSTYNAAGNSFSFAHKMAMLRLNLTMPETGNCTISLQNNGSDGNGVLYSGVTLDATTGDLKSGSTTSSLALGATKSVTAGGISYIYMTLFPQKVQNFTITLTYDNGNKYTKTLQESEKELVAGHLYCATQSYFTVTKYISSTKASPVTLIVTGADYTDSDLGMGGTFDTKAKACIDYMFNTEPYKTYKEYFNVYIIRATSADLGYVNTTTGSSYTYTLDRNTIISYMKRMCPDFKNGSAYSDSKLTVAILANTSLYFGLTHVYSSGSDFAVSTTGTNSYTWSGNGGSIGHTNTGDYRNVFLHEFGGHAFGRLMDEYWYSSSGAYSGSSIEGEHQWSIPYGKNIMTAADVSSIGYYWNHMIVGEGTGTTFPKEGKNYEGGGVYATGTFRPEQISVMDDNRPYFNAYSRQLIVERILSLAGETFDYEMFCKKDVNYDPVAKTMKVFTGGTIVAEQQMAPPVVFK